MLHPAALGALIDDARLAAELASGAGTLLMALRAEDDAVDDPARLGAAGDATAQAHIAERLAAARPGDALLSEEAPDDRRRLAAQRVWIVDPLDGTREFSERLADGSWRDDFAVHVALWQRGRGLTDGAVALPARARLYSSADPGPARSAGGRASAPSGGPLRIAVSRARAPAALLQVSGGAVELVPMGSTGVKAMAVLDGVVDAYVHAGGQAEWDTAAPVAVATAAGLVATRLDGSPLVYNKSDPSSPDVVICHPRVADRLARFLRDAGLAVPTEAA